MDSDFIPDFKKGDGLLPVVVQSYETKEILMLGYMNKDAYQRTKESGLVTFFSRSKNSLWVKGETSGNFLMVKSISLDCDSDAILVQAEPKGPTCHTGKDSCFFKPVFEGDSAEGSTGSSSGFSLRDLEQVIQSRKHEGSESSYTRTLFEKGITKIAQKVGEEAVEVVIAALSESDEKFLEESADLMFHFLVLLAEKKKSLGDVERVLGGRNVKSRYPCALVPHSPRH
jgi:phosphoribosyl-AMP cyclohydrolase / phosphoribosyl-ATP pyrophosphohydrolase